MVIMLGNLTLQQIQDRGGFQFPQEALELLQNRQEEVIVSISKEELENRLRGEQETWPQAGDGFWWVNATGESILFKRYRENEVDKALIAIGNIYRTERDAESAVRAQKLIAAVARRRKEFNGDWRPVWGNGFIKYFICYREERLESQGTLCNDAKVFGAYKNSESVRAIIDEFHDELLWFFTEYVVSVN